MSIRWTYAFIDRPAETYGRACDFWTTVTGTRLSPPRGDQDEFVTLLAEESEAGDACVKAQGVTSGPGGAHLDLCPEDVPALVESALRLGAQMVADLQGGAVLRSPGGQLFCVVPWHGESVRPPATQAPDGSTSRLDQVCIDLSPPAYDRDVTFWPALTGWNAYPGSRPEFHIVESPGLPVRLLLQRLDEARPTSAHLDLSCSDMDATRTWHESLGATFVNRGAGWLVMRDPAGGTYCLTARDPATGGLPA
ncbi:VOC family protein [Streptomyces sp. CA-288835]|uniref:VOC family protein n=1 Tax=Streptomyces sp. CA-288835 TaxID=3240069 RepID=UPI003D8BD7D1